MINDRSAPPLLGYAADSSLLRLSPAAPDRRHDYLLTVGSGDSTASVIERQARRSVTSCHARAKTRGLQDGEAPAKFCPTPL
jgi:hypothetical protein